MYPSLKKYYYKDEGDSLPPGFWIGIIMILILFYFVERCKGGTL